VLTLDPLCRAIIVLRHGIFDAWTIVLENVVLKNGPVSNLSHWLVSELRLDQGLADQIAKNMGGETREVIRARVLNPAARTIEGMLSNAEVASLCDVSPAKVTREEKNARSSIASMFVASCP
jgi:hypothetical protein